VYGVPNNSGSYTHMGALANISPSVNIEHEDIPLLGKYRIWKSIMMGAQYLVGTRYRPIDTQLQNQGSLVPNGAGTNDESLNIVQSMLVDGTEKYEIYKGLITTNFVEEITRLGVNITQDFEASDISDFGASQAAIGVGSATLVTTDPTESPWTGISSGLDPITLAGIKENTGRVQYSAQWGIAKLRPNGTISIKYQGPASLRYGVEVQLWLGDSTSMFGYLKNYTPIELKYQVTPNVRFEFDSVRFFGYTRSMDAGGAEYQTEAYVGMGDSDIEIYGTTY
jgi:hypothetical protein